MQHSRSSATKSKKKRSSLPLRRLQATKRRLGLPNALNKNQSHGFPGLTCSVPFGISRAPCYSVSVALQAPPAVKMQQQENEQLELEESVRTAAVMKSRNRSGLRKWRISTSKGEQAGHAVLRLFLRRPCRKETLAHVRTMQCNSRYTKPIYAIKSNDFALCWGTSICESVMYDSR